MENTPSSSKTSLSYEETWNTNEPIYSQIWDECDPTPPNEEETDKRDETHEDSDETITENEDNPLSSESAVFETPIASQILENANLNAEENQEVAVTDIPSNPVYDVPPGKYRLVGWNLNMTGNRLIDEICQISGYTFKEKFNLYIMPHGNPNNYMREHYGLQISSSGPYRMLRDVTTRRFLKTRSDVAALTEFISWLEDVKGDNDGVVLIFHDIKKLVSLKILQCVKRYNLLEKFKNIVKGFCNICSLAESKSGETKYFSLKVLSNVLLPYRSNTRKGSNKARTCHDVLIELLLGAHNCSLYTNLNRKATKRMSDAELIRQVCDNIIQHLENQADEQQKRKNRNTSEMIYKYSVTVNSEEVLLVKFEELLDRQNSFRNVFKDLMNFDHPTRQMINRVRRKIVNQNLSFKDVEDAWMKNKCQGLEEFFNSVQHITEKEFDLITEIFERHFDPELESYLGMLINERKTQKIKEENDVKDDLAKSFAKLPKISEDDEESVQGHRRSKSV